jgi:transglutaminase-like putative cysteine protease
VLLTAVFVCWTAPHSFGQGAAPDWHLVYTASHRASYEKEWKYTFPDHRSTRWVIALRYPPQLAWSKDAAGKAELLTSAGWKPFKEVTEGSKEKRRMLVIDYEHDDPKLRNGFTIRTTLTATIYHQQLVRGRPARPAPPLAAEEKESYLAETDTFDFSKGNVKEWMDAHKMWLGKAEKPIDFVHRVYKELRLQKSLPYDTKDGGPWVCSQILKVGYGECCRHAIVGTSILRTHQIPARTVCGLWAIDEKSKGGHCWGEFFLEGVGWVPYDTTVDGTNLNTEAYFGSKKGEVLAGMIDFDWGIDAGSFGKQTVFAIDAFPAYWSKGEGSLDKPKLDTTESVRILKRSR